MDYVNDDPPQYTENSCLPPKSGMGNANDDPPRYSEDSSPPYYGSSPHMRSFLPLAQLDHHWVVLNLNDSTNTEHEPAVNAVSSNTLISLPVV
ncbi:hypothetical protein EJ04DRAFT_564209 [Polyplosphaeria fusca]|uniref:Uncharacterized protein n=1 Tax=Polyplosphaeria fusca TaxID=682080 RepID=A0A9P4QVK1_9PLEO|nr:hypothetical protein EJ04DRAFT_564209 [Polyplosphaeria fusca]